MCPSEERTLHGWVFKKPVSVEYKTIETMSRGREPIFGQGHIKMSDVHPPQNESS
jgi:hypothetical protein